MKELIKRSEIEILDQIRTDRKETLKFKYNGRYFNQTYNKGNGWGFKFITEYPNELALLNPLTVACNPETIYSQHECTDFGRHLEFSLFKLGL